MLGARASWPGAALSGRAGRSAAGRTGAPKGRFCRRAVSAGSLCSALFASDRTSVANGWFNFYTRGGSSHVPSRRIKCIRPWPERTEPTPPALRDRRRSTHGCCKLPRRRRSCSPSSIPGSLHCVGIRHWPSDRDGSTLQSVAPVDTSTARSEHQVVPNSANMRIVRPCNPSWDGGRWALPLPHCHYFT